MKRRSTSSPNQLDLFERASSTPSTLLDLNPAETVNEPEQKAVTPRRQSKGHSSLTGDVEPTWDRIFLDPADFKAALVAAFNWYNEHATGEKLKKWTIEYLMHRGGGQTVGLNESTRAALEALDDRRFHTIGAMCRMRLRGMQPNEQTRESFTRLMKTLYAEAKETYTENRERAKAKAAKKAIQKINPLVAEVVKVLDGHVDRFFNNGEHPVHDVTKLFTANRLTPDETKRIADRYAPRAQDIRDALNGDDELKQAYFPRGSGITAGGARKLLEFYDQIANAAANHKNAPKAVNNKPRKPRKKKQKTPAQLVKKLNFAPNWEKYKSIDPEDIIGADQLWAFHVPTRKLQKYVSTNGDGLTVKGSTIQGFDEEKSFAKKLRKPQEILPPISQGGKVLARQTMDGVRAVAQKLTGRINKDTLLLRVF